MLAVVTLEKGISRTFVLIMLKNKLPPPPKLSRIVSILASLVWQMGMLDVKTLVLQNRVWSMKEQIPLALLQKIKRSLSLRD